MNWIDLIISLLLVYAFYNGFKNGLILELTALLALVLGVFAAYYYADITAHYLDKWVDWSDAVLMTFAFILTFIIVVILINLIGKIISKIIGMIALGLVNKIAGGIFGLLKIFLLISVLFLVADAVKQYVDLFQYKIVQSSYILNFYEENILELFPQIIDTLEEKLPDKETA
jgi:membrane protein required for colicin V production